MYLLTLSLSRHFRIFFNRKIYLYSVEGTPHNRVKNPDSDKKNPDSAKITPPNGIPSILLEKSFYLNPN